MTDCPECGYNLTGLSLPHPCPECGFLCDSTSYPRTVAQWYKSWRGLFFVRVPAHAAAYLHDPACRRIAGRRLLVGVLLPWFVATGVLVLLNGVIISKEFEKSWEYPNRPGERIISYPVTRDDRLFNLNLHLFEGPGFLGYTPPAGAVSHAGPVSVTWRLGRPDPDFRACMFLGMPSVTLAGLLGLFVLSGIARSRRRDVSVGRAQAWALVSSFCIVYVPAVLPIIAAALCDGATRLGVISHPSTYVEPLLFFLPLGLSAIGGAIQGLRLLHACRPRRRNFPALLRLAVFAVLIMLPPAACVLLWRLTSRL